MPFVSALADSAFSPLRGIGLPVACGWYWPPVARRLLVVTTVPLEGSTVRDQVQAKVGDADAEVHIVAPAARMSPLQWLASDEDAAREQAAEAAQETAEAVDADARVETEVGDPDPVQAIEDALRTFPADELVVVTRRGDEATWLEKDAGAEALDRFGLPVTHLAVD
jgi:nucleotide-binding universal stress UspA family protein